MEKVKIFTVNDLIETLKKFDGDAVVCVTDINENELTYRSLDTIELVLDGEYVDNNANFKRGSLISFF